MFPLYKYLSPPSAQTVGILLFTWRISTSLSRIAIHKGLSARCDSTRASRTYTVIFVSWALCGLIVEFIVFHYMIFALGMNIICFKLDFCLYSTSRQATLLYSSTIPQGCYSQNSDPILVYWWAKLLSSVTIEECELPVLRIGSIKLLGINFSQFNLQTGILNEL